MNHNKLNDNAQKHNDPLGLLKLQSKTMSAYNSLTMSHWCLT